jgi:hypothetical protein
MKLPFEVPIIGGLSPPVRAVTLVAVCVLLIFLAFRWFGSDSRQERGGSSTAPHAPKPETLTQSKLNVAITNLVRKAALSAQKAGESKHVLQQIVHIREGITMLDSARAFESNDDRLSLISRINVDKLSNYLVRAEEMCVQKLRSTTEDTDAST